MQFVSVGNCGYSKFLKNLIFNFQQPYMKNHKIYIYCIDNKIFHELSSLRDVRNFSNVELELVPFSSEVFSVWGTESFNKIAKFKFSLVAKAASRFKPMYYVDGDIAFLKDPQMILDKYGNYDLVFQSDVSNDNIYMPNQCSGSFFSKGTAEAIRFLEEAVSHHEFTKGGDQASLNQVFKASNCFNVNHYKHAKITSFDCVEFPSGHYSFNKLYFLLPDVVCVHANFMKGEQNKIDALALSGAWYLPDYANVLIICKIKFYLHFVRYLLCSVRSQLSLFFKKSYWFFIGKKHDFINN